MRPIRNEKSRSHRSRSRSLSRRLQKSRPGSRSLRLRLVGTKSNRDAIGALVRVFTPDGAQSRRVKSGSSYLSQSELAVTFGLGKRESAARVVIEWPSGAVQEFKNVRAGFYQCTEGQMLKPSAER